MFNSYFAKQCSLINSDSSLPCETIKKTNNSLYSVRFSTEDILQIINNLDSNKAHGHDEISIRVLKICGSPVCRPLQIIYKSCLDRGKFSQEWKKANVVPVHKKNDKQLVRNYRPISLLPICGKIFERILYNFLFNFLNQNGLISPAQSGFKPGDSCINQLLSITHEIYHSIDEGYEIRGVFLDISKAFDKVMHEGLVFKLKQNGISGNLLNIFEDCLRNRKQRVVLNGRTSNWKNIHGGFPQGSILGPLLFLICINDLAENLPSNPKGFADDTSLFSVVRDLNTTANEINPVKKVLPKNIWVCSLMVNLIFMNILEEFLIKLVNLLVLCVSSEFFYRDHLFYKSTNLLLDFTLITVISSMIRRL